MQQVTGEASTGTKYRFDSDRQFEGRSGDSILTVQGQRPEGGQVFDATFVELDEREAQVTSNVLRALTQPPQSLTGRIAQEIQAMFPQLTGRDAHQIAEVTGRVWSECLASELGQEPEREQRLNGLSERYQRAAAQRRNARNTAQDGGANGGGLESPRQGKGS